MQHYVEGEVLKSINFQDQPLTKGDYESCRFEACVFSNSDLQFINFIECEFIDCDFSTANINQTAFKEVSFTNCKMLGLRFDSCNTFLLEMKFDQCQLNLSSFYKLSLKGIHFKNCELQEVEFVESDLSKSLFDDCDLNGAVFENTNLEQVDMHSSYGYNIDPENNNIRKGRFSLEGLPGLLVKYQLKF